jgi:hypothetical protein
VIEIRRKEKNISKLPALLVLEAFCCLWYDATKALAAWPGLPASKLGERAACWISI